MDDIPLSHGSAIGPLGLHFEMSYELLTTTIYKTLSVLFGNGNYHGFRSEPEEDLHKFAMWAQSDNGHGHLDAGEIIAFRHGHTNVLIQWPKTRPPSNLHDFPSQADYDGMVRQECDEAVKVVHAALRQAEQAVAGTKGRLPPMATSTTLLPRPTVTEVEVGTKAYREAWYQYKYDADKSGVVKFTHKDLGNYLGLDDGTVRNYYNDWKDGPESDDAKMTTV